MMTRGDNPQSRKPGRAEHTTSAAPGSDVERFGYLLEMLPDAVVVANAAGRIMLVNRQAETIFGYSRADLLGQPIEHLIPQRFRQAHRRHRADYATAPGMRSMGMTLQVSARRKDGSEFPAEVRLSTLPDMEHPDELLALATVRDVSERQQLENERRQAERDRRQMERARREAEAAAEELRRVQAITDIALSHQTLDTLLPAVLAQLCAELQVDRAAILLMAGDGQALTLRAACGPEEEPAAAEMRVPVGEGFAGRIAASRAPLVIDDLSAFPTVNPFLREQLRSALGVPLMVEGQLLGVAHVGSKTPRRFSERDVRLLQLVTERVALAIDRAQLYDAAQAALARARQQEARATRLVAANLIGVIVADGERLIEANDAFLQMVGYSRTDLEAGRLRWPEMTPPEYAPLNERALAEVRKLGVCTPFEKEYMRKDGSRVPILIRVAQLEDRPELHVSFVVDLSERVRLQDTVTQTAAQLDAVFQTMVDGVVVYDAEGRITQMNAAMRDLFAVDAMPDYAQRSLEERAAFFAPRDAAGQALPREAWPQTRLLHGEVLVGASAEDVLLRGLDGRDVLVSATGAPLRNAAGAVTGAVLALRDVTAQRRLEREARELAAQLQATFDTMAGLVFVYDPAGRPLRMNAATWALLGLADDTSQAAYSARSAGERAEPFILRAVDGQPLPLEAYPVARVLRGETLTAVEPQDVRITDANGRERVLSFTGGPMRDAAGTLLGYVTVGHDITALKQLERARAEAEAREMATREVSQQLDDFFTTAAHDIRNPVSVVKMSVQMARRRFERLRARAADLATADLATADLATADLATADLATADLATADLATAGGAAPSGGPSEDREEDRAGSDTLESQWEAAHASLRAAEADADRLARLTIQLFDVARARAGRLELDLAPCDLALLVREQVAAQRLATPERTIHLELPADRQMVMARVDADRLSQVLANYLTNALKYSTEDQPVTVALEVTEELAVALVRDHGPGLPEDERSKIWEPFHRARGIQALSRLGKATGSLGMGLHICKHIVELHPGGQVGVESEVGKGSTFWFRLPLLREEDEVQRQA